eukprot:TRINITY_DN4052_c0_g1_i1.p1 TRINITY_DN4052_c0_g1~~TRINITY_DN4052_c0_g1_i1.p1  ORF type:complete len:352 (+),score=71.40 TRINITY_DN4052_c0_g1_i1:217-1272(+)
MANSTRGRSNSEYEPEGVGLPDDEVKTIKLDSEEKGEEQLEKFEKLKEVGSGTYAVVYKAKNVETDKIYALKVIRMDESGDEGVPFTVIREISLLKRLKHPNIVRLHQVINTEKKGMTLVFEYLYCDLKKYMVQEKKIQPHEVKSFLFQLLQGTAFCHKNHVLHRDLKPQNLLINKKGELKLADFGLARFNGIPVARLSSQVVTLWYRAPDVLLGSHKYTSSIDIWAIGCIFAETITSRPLFRGSDDKDQVKAIFKKMGTPSEKTWPGLKELSGAKNANWKVYESIPLRDLVPGLTEDSGYDLLDKMLRYEPSERISAEAALSHPYFNEVILPKSLQLKYSKMGIATSAKK